MPRFTIDPGFSLNEMLYEQVMNITPETSWVYYDTYHILNKYTHLMLNSRYVNHHFRYLGDASDVGGDVPHYQVMPGNTPYGVRTLYIPTHGFYIPRIDVFFGPEGDFDVTASEDSAVGLQLRGSNGDNKVIGTKFVDVLIGRGGDDTLYGKGGNDWLYGGTGNDKLYGGDGNDILYGIHGDDTLYGGADSDTLKGGYGDDLLDGGTGSDKLHGGSGSDKIYGGDGDDRIYYDPTDSVIDGGTGNDTLILKKGTYTISGTVDNLKIIKHGVATNESQTITSIEILVGYKYQTYIIKMEKPVEGLTLSANLIDTNPAILISEPEAVFENPRKGDVIYTVEASDPDVGEGSDDFEYTLVGDPTDFAIDKDGGAITYTGDPIISDSTHTLTIQSTEVDSGATASHAIQITLLSTEMTLDFSGEERGNIFGYQNERVEFNGDGNDIKQIHGDHGWDPEMQHTQNDTIIINGENNEIDGVYGNQGNDVLVFNGTNNKINSIGGGGGDDKIHINTHIFKHGDNKYVYMHGGEGHDQLHFKKASHWALGSNDNNWVTDNRGDYKKEGDFSNPDEVFYFRHEDVEYILTGFEEITVGGNPIYEIA